MGFLIQKLRIRCDPTQKLVVEKPALSHDDVLICKNHANELSLKRFSLYQKRNPNLTLEKCRLDILVGKLGEFHWYREMEERGISCTPPDLSIRESFSEDPWAPDLFSEEVGVSVKAQTLGMASRYSPTWTVQWSLTGLGQDVEIVNSLNVAFTTICLPDCLPGADPVHYGALLWGVYSMQDIISQGALRDPRNSVLGDQKRAVYAYGSPIWGPGLDSVGGGRFLEAGVAFNPPVEEPLIEDWF